MCLSTLKGQSLAGIKLFAGLDLEARDAIASLCTGAGFESGDVLESRQSLSSNEGSRGDVLHPELSRARS